MVSAISLVEKEVLYEYCKQCDTVNHLLSGVFFGSGGEKIPSIFVNGVEIDIDHRWRNI